MIIDSSNNISILTQEKLDILDFITQISERYDKLKSNNLVINLLSFNGINSEDITKFLSLSNSHRELNKSFVIVAQDIDYDAISEELVLVPTLQEAYDMIEMESIERDLGL
ncbi:MAG: ribonuclease Z [Bacteroidota bacterium]